MKRYPLLAFSVFAILFAGTFALPAHAATAPTFCTSTQNPTTDGCVYRCDDPRAASCGTGYTCDSTSGYCVASSNAGSSPAAGSVEQGGACTSTTQCAGNLTCQSGVCNINYSCTAPCGQQNGGVQPGGQCAYNYDCADQGSTLYSCINGACAPDQGTVSQGSACTSNNDCAGNLACIAGICQVDTTTLPSGSTGATTGTTGSGAGGLNLTYLTGYKTSILNLVNGILVPILISVAFIFFIWSVYLYFIKGAEDPKAHKTGQQYTMYAIVGFAIIFSLWGLVNLVAGTFNLAGGSTAASHGLTVPTL